MWHIILPALLLILIIVLRKLNEYYFILSLCKRIKTEDGTKLEDKVVVIPGTTSFGNNFDLLHITPEKLFKFCRDKIQYSRGKSYIFHFLFTPVYSITTAEDVEAVLQSTTLIKKSLIYDLLIPFLGDGLLVSTDQKWHFRRKMLTPAFHFNVLQSFNEMFKEESLKFLNKLQNLQNDTIDVADVTREFTLNNVCETALGVKLDNLSGSGNYRKSIHDIEVTTVRRMCNPLMYYDLVFRFSDDYTKQKEAVTIAHFFSNRIIERKRREYLTNKQKSSDTKENEFGVKKRYAMLDTLLECEAQGLIDHLGICDEVNTFMFEGYDTTSTCLIFSMLNLSLHPEVQEKCRKEIQNLGDFESLTMFDFNKLEYLECVLKETLRMYPSVPAIARMCTEKTHLNGLILPPYTQINIHLYDIMRDPKHFPEPNVFNPERFRPDAADKRHPFAFVPFSAGSRNCIGQKFALLEMKTILVAILRNFEILPVTKLEDLVFYHGLILRTQQKIFVKLKKIQK